MSGFEKHESFSINPTSSLTRWVSESTGLAVIHLNRSSTLKGQLIVDTRKGGNQEIGLFLGQTAEDYFDSFEKTGKHPFISYHSEAEYDCIKYSVESDEWQTFKPSLRFLVDSILHHRPVDENPAQLLARCRRAWGLKLYRMNIPAELIYQPYKRNVLYGESNVLPVHGDSILGVNVPELERFRTITHQPESMLIIIQGRVEEDILLSFLRELEDEFFLSANAADIDHVEIGTGKRKRRKTTKSPKRTFPHGEVFNLKVPIETPLSTVSWKLDVQNPVHYMALWVLRQYFHSTLAAFHSTGFDHFDDFLSSIFTISHPIGSRIKPEVLVPFLNVWPQSYARDIVPLKQSIRKLLCEKSFPLETSFYNYLKVSFLYESGDLSPLKTWSEARQHLKELWSWSDSDWKMIVRAYLVKTEPIRINLQYSKELFDLWHEIEVFQRDTVGETYSFRIDYWPDKRNFSKIRRITSFDYEYPTSRGKSGYDPRSKSVEHHNRDSMYGKTELDSKKVPISLHFNHSEDEVTRISIELKKSRIQPSLLNHLPDLERYYNHQFAKLSTFDPKGNFLYKPPNGVLDFKFKEYFSDDLWDEMNVLEVATLEIDLLPETYEKSIDWLSDLIGSIFRPSVLDNYKPDETPNDDILSRMRLLAMNLFQLNNMSASVTGNMAKLEHPAAAWMNFTGDFGSQHQKKLSNIRQSLST